MERWVTSWCAAAREQASRCQEWPHLCFPAFPGNGRRPPATSNHLSGPRSEHEYPSSVVFAELTKWGHSGVPSVTLRTRRIFCYLNVSTSDVVILLVVIWMGVAIIPVFRLLPLVRLREFVRILVIFGKVLSPGAIFVVVPVVIILVVLIIDSSLIVSVSIVVVLLLTLVALPTLIILLGDGQW